MQEITRDCLIEKASELLANGTVNRVFGWKRGEFAYDVTPAVFDSKEAYLAFVDALSCTGDRITYLEGNTAQVRIS